MQHVDVVDVADSQQYKLKYLLGFNLIHPALLLQQCDQFLPLDLLTHDEVLVVPDFTVNILHYIRGVEFF